MNNANPKAALVCGAGGFVASHLVRRLKSDGFWVRGVDLKYPEYSDTLADDFVIGDLRRQDICHSSIDRRFDEVYQLAADMGGAGYIFTGEHDADVMHNSASINLNILDACHKRNIKKIFYSSSACMYPEYNQLDPLNPKCTEDSAYPAAPDSEYGWEKLFSERVYLAFRRNYGMATHVARYHNIFGPEGTWTGGKEKAPAAICRKVAMAKSGEAIEIWGDGEQTRSFLFIDDCIEGTTRLLRSDFSGPEMCIRDRRMVRLIEVHFDRAELVKRALFYRVLTRYQHERWNRIPCQNTLQALPLALGQDRLEEPITNRRVLRGKKRFGRDSKTEFIEHNWLPERLCGLHVDGNLLRCFGYFAGKAIGHILRA